MDKEKKNPNVPNLRFSDFQDAWKFHYVSDVLTVVPTNSLTWDELNYENGKLKNIHYGLIHNGFKTTCISDSNELIPWINNNKIPKKYTLLNSGDLILADASEDRKDVGRPVEIIESNNNTISGLHTIHAKNKTNLIVNGFKGYYFQSSEMKKQIYKIANGSKIYSISPNNFDELVIAFPSKAEQKKIVTLLSIIEERIQTQIKIINKYESLINQIYNHVLWNNTDAEKVHLGDILIEKNVKSTVQNQFPILSSTVKGLFLQSEYFEKEIASTNNIGYKITNIGDVILSPQNLWMGNITYNDKFFNGLVSPSYKIFTINKNFDPVYVATLLKSDRMLQRYKSVSEQGASVVRRNLNLDSFYNISVKIPDKHKQQKIGKAISIFNEKKCLEEKYLNSLIKQKQFLLNNMFI